MKAKEAKFYSIKDEVRIVGFDDGPFNFREDKDTIVVGAICRGGSFLDGVMSFKVDVDGMNATEKVVEVVKNTRFKDLRVVMTDGLSFAGFNMVDLERIFEETGLPAICVVREYPNFDEIREAMQRFDDFGDRWDCIERAGKPEPVQLKHGKRIYMQFKGIREEDAKEIIKLSATHSLLPEPVRLAHLIAQGIVLGESKGKA
ncbi:DUF99 family protein [Candidatus Altiarchaeota archaeon]